jgi:hypothetical protein
MTLLTFIVLCLFSFLSFGQTSSFVGSYKHTTWHGGGFAGGPDGSCYMTPPTYSVTDVIVIEATGRILKLSDTTFYSGTIHSIFDFSCDTLFIGQWKAVNDSLIATYNLKPLCDSLAIYWIDQPPLPHKKLNPPIVETYYWIANEAFTGLKIGENDFEKKVD